MGPLPPDPSPRALERVIQVALGQAPADTVIRGGRLVNVFTEQVEPPASIALAEGRVVSLGPESPAWLGPDTRLIEAEGQYLLPGLIDAHTHLDSIFTLSAYAPYALASGNTAALSETAMAAGAGSLAGVLAFLEEAAAVPFRVFSTAPPLVPPFPKLETSAGLCFDEFQTILERPDCLAVGEAYWPAVTDRDPRVMRRLALAQALGKRLDGHAAGARGEKLMAYAASGITSCHESITPEEALERLRLGLAVQIREGFVRQEMPVVVPALIDLPDTRQVSLVTDLAPMDLTMAQGTMNVLLARAVALGVAPARATAWCSLNPARYLGLNRLGAVAPGFVADLFLCPDLVNFRPSQVFLGGELAAQDGQCLLAPAGFSYPKAMYETVRGPALSLDELRLPASGPRAQARVIKIAGDTITREDAAELPVVDGSAQADPRQDVLKLAHYARHSAERKVALAFVSGWGMRGGAVATSLSWDKASMIVWGATDAEMVLAARRVHELGGGTVVAAGERILAEQPLPIMGNASPLPLPEVVAEMRAIETALAELGCGLARPLLTAQTLCFTGLPFLRLTDLGLVDVRRRQFVSPLL